jgi:SAM-dependent methyltransferase
MLARMCRSEADLLAEINRDLPKGIDWKQGAITYLRELIQDGGPTQEWYHLLKPFVGGPDYEPFWVDVLHFLDMVKAADLAPGDLLLDVGCGPGWTVQWLAKLGHEVIGLDISPELIEIAERRMRTDPYPPYVGRPFRYALHVHDIEERPLGLERKARFALFESVLHHFLNPVAALRHVAADLADDGLVAVIEGAAPPRGSEWDQRNIEIMERYGTIERPYTRGQLLDIFDLAGIPYVSFVRPVNGAVAQDVDSISSLVRELSMADNVNTLFASPTAAGIERLGLTARRVDELRARWTVVTGGHSLEHLPQGSGFRWCGPQTLVRLDGPGPHDLRVGTEGLVPREVQTIHVVNRGEVHDSKALTYDQPEATFTVTGHPGQVIELQSNRVFSPCWQGGHDSRVLSFRLAVGPAGPSGTSPDPPAGTAARSARRFGRSLLRRLIQRLGRRQAAGRPPR